MPQDPVAPLVADYARYRADETIRLEDYDTAETDDLTPEEARAELASLISGIRGRGQRHLHRLGAVVHRALGPQVVPQPGLGRIVRATLEAMNPCWPRPDEDLEAYALEELEESASSKR